MEKILQQILDGQQETNKRLSAIETRLDSIEKHAKNTNEILGKNTHYIEALSYDVAKIVRLEARVNITAKKVSELETDVEMLKTAN